MTDSLTDWGGPEGRFYGRREGAPLCVSGLSAAVERRERFSTFRLEGFSAERGSEPARTFGGGESPFAVGMQDKLVGRHARARSLYEGGLFLSRLFRVDHGAAEAAGRARAPPSQWASSVTRTII